MTALRTIVEELTEAMSILAQSGVDTPQLDAEVLMAHVISSSRMHVISHPGQRLRHEEVELYKELIRRRSKREPLAYITGEREFWGLNFEVTPAVLVPRQETETLVETALSMLPKERDLIIADIGAGTGCVAIALAVELPSAVVYTTEVSREAAEIARRNALRHQVEIRVPVLEGDMFDPLPEDVKGRLDAVVSNPPYIPSAELDTLQPEVAKYEPRGALDGGPDGMMYHRRILDEARDWLKPGGWVHMEIGIGQAEAVSQYARQAGYRDVRVTKDLGGIPRVVSACVSS